MAEVITGGFTYATTAKLDAFSQLHISRKLGPALPIMEGLVNPSNADKDKGILVVLMLSHIGDADVEYIIRKCLSVVVRRDAQGKGAKIQAPDGSMMFDDIPLASLLDIAVAVIDENVGDFFRTALANMDKQSGQAQT